MNPFHFLLIVAATLLLILGGAYGFHALAHSTWAQKEVAWVRDEAAKAKLALDAEVSRLRAERDGLKDHLDDLSAAFTRYRDIFNPDTIEQAVRAALDKALDKALIPKATQPPVVPFPPANDTTLAAVVNLSTMVLPPRAEPAEEADAKILKDAASDEG